MILSVFKNKPIAILAGVLCLWGFSAVDLQAGNNPDQDRDNPDFSESAAGLPVYLYFGDNTNQNLVGEERSNLNDDDPVVFCRQIMDALIQGPAGNLVRTLPAEAEIRAVFVHNQTAYVDFSREITALHPGGIHSELLTIYSVVNTLVLNVDNVDQVKILIGGQEAETLAGHIDIRFPLNADMLLIR